MKNDEPLFVGDKVVVDFYEYHNTTHKFDDESNPALIKGMEYIVEAIDRSPEGYYPSSSSNRPRLGIGYTIKIGGRAFGSVAVSLVNGALQKALEIIYKD